MPTTVDMNGASRGAVALMSDVFNSLSTLPSAPAAPRAAAGGAQ